MCITYSIFILFYLSLLLFLPLPDFSLFSLLSLFRYFSIPFLFSYLFLIYFFLPILFFHFYIYLSILPLFNIPYLSILVSPLINTAPIPDITALLTISPDFFSKYFYPSLLFLCITFSIFILPYLSLLLPLSFLLPITFPTSLSSFPSLISFLSTSFSRSFFSTSPTSPTSLYIPCRSFLLSFLANLCCPYPAISKFTAADSNKDR